MSVALAAVSARGLVDAEGRPRLCVAVDAGDRGGVSVTGPPVPGCAAEVADAVRLIEEHLGAVLVGRHWDGLADIDRALVAATRNRGRPLLPAGMLLTVSSAVARALARARGEPLWRLLGSSLGSPRLPVPVFTMMTGRPDLAPEWRSQRFMIAPASPSGPAAAWRAAWAVHRALATRVGEAAAGQAFTPRLDSAEQACDLVVAAIEAAGYPAAAPGCSAGVGLAVDMAAGESCVYGIYRSGNRLLSTQEMIDRYAAWTRRYPICFLQDPLGEDDDTGWATLTDRFGGRSTGRVGDRVRILGGARFASQPTVVTDGIRRRLASGAVIDPAAIGTVTDALRALEICRRARWATATLASPGHDVVADLATGAGGGWLAVGTLADSRDIGRRLRIIAEAGPEPAEVGPTGDRTAGGVADDTLGD